jgi:hypothetical protein
MTADQRNKDSAEQLNTLNNGQTKSELGAKRPAKSATDEELQPGPCQPQPFEVNALAGRYRSQF